MTLEPTVIVRCGHRLNIGAQLNDIFEVERFLGAGGMSEVYLSRNIRTREPVAIKVILANSENEDERLRLFEKEASVLNKISHPAVVRYYLFSKDRQTDLHYLAMEYVPGPSLYERISSRPLTLRDACSLVRRVALGMQSAHAEAVVHRDLSCDNIILAHGDATQAKIIDFGIAKTEIGEAPIVDGAFAGKYGYVSPEQLGLFGGEVTAVSDVYSLGLVLAAALLGKPLEMGGSQSEVLRKRQSVPDLWLLNPAIKPALERMLQPNPADRPQSMLEVADLVAPFAKVENEAARSTIKRQTILRPVSSAMAATAQRSRKTALVLGLFISAATITGGWQIAAQTPYGKRLQDAISGGRSLFFGSSKSESKLSGPIDSRVASPPPIPSSEPSPQSPKNPQSITAPGMRTEVARAEPGSPPRQALLAPSASAPRASSGGADPALWVGARELGECALARLTAFGENEAEIEGFGLSAQPFVRLERDFEDFFGLEPVVGVRPLQPAQCPALKFVIAHKSELLPRSTIALTKDLLGPREPLLGVIEGVKSPHVNLLLVDGEGRVRDFSNGLRRSDGHIVFRFGLDPLKGGVAAENYLMIALGSSRPITGVRSFNAEKLFDVISREIAARNLSIELAARFFRRRK